MSLLASVSDSQQFITSRTCRCHISTEPSWALHALTGWLNTCVSFWLVHVGRVCHFFSVVAMEVSNAQRPRGTRPRPSFTSSTSSRPYSRSSTRTPSARMFPQSNNDSSSNVTSSPSLRNGQPPTSSRQPNRKGSMGSNVDRPPTPISKSSAKDSQSSAQQEPQSTLLHEKLQKERRSEIQRNLDRLTGDMSNSGTANPRAATATPVRCATADGRRPALMDQNGDIGKKRGPALKEMEQVRPQPPAALT